MQLNQEGLAELPKTLPIHKRGEDQLVREGAQARMASGGERTHRGEIVEIISPPSHASIAHPLRPGHPPTHASYMPNAYPRLRRSRGHR